MKRFLIVIAALAVLILSAAAYIFGILPGFSFAGILLILIVRIVPVRSLHCVSLKGNQFFPKYLCSERIRKYSCFALLICTVIYVAVSVVKQFPESSFAVNTCELKLHDPKEREYTKRVFLKNGFLMIAGAFSKDTIVSGDGQKLKEVFSPDKINTTTFLNKGAFLQVSDKLETLKFQSPRKIVSLLSSPKWIIALFLLIGLLFSVREMSMLPEDRKTDKPAVLLLFVSVAICIFCMMLPELFPLKYTVDGPHYLYLTNGDTLRNCLVSYRTPGYPLFLKFALLFSPSDLSCLILFQYGLYFLALIWLLWELKVLGFPVFCCIVMELLFAKYMWCYHNFVLADSLNLTGVIALLAMAMLMLRRFLNPECPLHTKIFLHISAMILVFLQLMIKPFPGTILIPAGMLFLGFAFHGQWKKAFSYGILSACLCVLLPVLFCSYRYYKYKDFNFASLVSFQVSSSAILLMEKDGMDKLDSDTRDDVESIIRETLQKNPELVWPMDIMSPGFKAETYAKYADRIMYFPGLWNGSWLSKRDRSKYASFELLLEFESRKLMKKLLPHIDKKKFMQLRMIYLRELGNYLQYPRLCSYNLAENSPFGNARRCFWMLFLPAAIMILFSRLFAQPNDSLLQAFLLIVFLGSISIFSTCLLVAPYIEVRREMIGLFSVLFGSFALIFYSIWYSVLTLYCFLCQKCLSFQKMKE